MAVIALKLVTGTLDRVLLSFTHLKVYRAPVLDGVYVEITTPATRIPLVSTQTVYDFTDENGAAGYYYKCSYYHPVTLLESSLSEAQQGEGDPALDIVSIDDLKTSYLFGLDMTNDRGVPFPDSLYAWFIKSAVSWLEHRINIAIRPMSVVDERHDYIREDYEQYIFVKLKNIPVLEVSEFRMVLPGDTEGTTYDPSWIYCQKESGQVQIVPGLGNVGTVFFGGAGLWHPYARAGHRLIPDVFRVSYTAGFAPEKVPDVIKDLIGKIAAFGPLNIAGDLLGGAGIASTSLSIDGLSQSINTTNSPSFAGYGARLINYTREIKEVIPTLRRYYRGANMMAC
jgi:hypothetical protein